MSILSFLLEMYFAAMLGVSGLTKLNDPLYFTNTLRQQGLLPPWSISPATKIFPWLEIILSLLLIAGIFAVWNALLLLALFVGFAGIKIVLIAKGYDKDCGCFGGAKPQQVDSLSITVAVVYVLLAGLHAWLIFHFPFISWLWRFPVLSIALIAVSYFTVRISIKNKRLLFTSVDQNSTLRGLAAGQESPVFTAVDQYNNIIEITTFRGKPCLLLFVLPGCSACPVALKALQRIGIKEPDLRRLVIATSDVELNQIYAIEQKIQVPVLTSTSSLLEEYHVEAFPFAIVLDAEGIVRAAGVAISYEQLRLLLSLSRKSEIVEVV